MTESDREIVQLVELQLGRRQVGLQDLLVEDLGAESADLVNLIVTLEDRYDIDIDEEEAAKLRTVSDLAELVRRLRGAR